VGKRLGRKYPETPAAQKAAGAAETPEAAVAA